MFSPYQIDIEHCLRMDINDNGLYSELEITPGNETVFKAKPEFYLRFDIFSPKIAPNIERTLNICIVLDRSASMNEHGRIEKLKIALREFVKCMKPSDYLSIVAYDDMAEVLLPAQKMSNVSRILAEIDAIVPNRGTNILAGLLMGYTEIRKNYDRTKINRLILMSDGMSNVGETSPSEIIRKSKKVSDGIETSTFGLGSDINFELMSGLARHGNGMSHFIGDCDSIYGDIGHALQEETENMIITMENISLTLEYPKQVMISDLYGYEVENAVTGKTTLKLMDIPANRNQIVLGAFKVKEWTNKPIIVKATLKYADKKSGKTKTVVRSIKLFCLSKSMSKIDPLSNEYVRSTYLLASLADELRKSLYSFWAKRYKESLFILDKCYFSLADEKQLPDNRRFEYLYKMLQLQRVFLNDRIK